MKKVVLLFALLFVINIVCATESTKYFEKQMSEKYNCPVNIKLIKEYSEPYFQKICERQITDIVYGEAYLKITRCKKTKISYVCLKDDNSKIVHCDMIP